jgi:hypothetical protein
MNQTLDFLMELRRIGAHVAIAGDEIMCEAKKGVLSESHKRQIVERKQELLELLQEQSYWSRLAGTRANPDDAWEHEDIIFLTACEVLRGADSAEHLLARWNGYKRWLSKYLSEAAMLALSDLFCSLGDSGLNREGE